MASLVDITKPGSTRAYTPDVRRNFEIIATEITDLQDRADALDQPGGEIEQLGTRVTAAQAAADGAVQLAGSTMTGDLMLFRDPVLPLHAATRQYIDNLTAPLRAEIAALRDELRSARDDSTS